MRCTIHTDLAIEAEALEKPKKAGKLSGVKSESYTSGKITVTKVDIIDSKGEAAIGKPKGSYITIEIPELRKHISDVFDESCKILTTELKKIINLKKEHTVLVVGLGNRFVTPDALGPKVVDRLFVTRHLYSVLPDDITSDMNPLCAVAPGVLGITGMETEEIIRGITDKVHPDIIIAIDALASRKTSRISSTFQIADTGIVPGSGIGNKRRGLTKDTLGVPVIAIGVPTVIEAAAVADDAIELMIEAIRANSDSNSQLSKAVSAFEGENRFELISQILTPGGGDMIVTPKEVDSMIDEISKIIAESINEAVNGETAKKLGEIL